VETNIFFRRLVKAEKATGESKQNAAET
jgi:hypothetical protein